MGIGERRISKGKKALGKFFPSFTLSDSPTLTLTKFLVALLFPY